MPLQDSSDSDAPPLSALFHVGQLLSCVIKETQSRKDSKKRRIRLSVHAPEVNQALSAEALRPGVVSDKTFSRILYFIIFYSY